MRATVPRAPDGDSGTEIATAASIEFLLVSTLRGKNFEQISSVVSLEMEYFKLCNWIVLEKLLPVAHNRSRVMGNVLNELTWIVWTA